MEAWNKAERPALDAMQIANVAMNSLRSFDEDVRTCAFLSLICPPLVGLPLGSNQLTRKAILSQAAHLRMPSASLSGQGKYLLSLSARSTRRPFKSAAQLPGSPVQEDAPDVKVLGQM